MRTRPVGGLALGAAALTLATVVAGCGGSGGGECPPGGSGNLTFIVDGRDAAPVAIDGVAATVTTTDNMSVTAGPHTISAARVTTPQSGITAQAFEPTIDHPMVCVRAAETTVVTVRYALIPTSGLLWAGAGNTPDGSTMLGFEPAAVAATGSASAAVAANTGGSDGFTFDRAGNIWVLGGTTADPPLARYPAAEFVSDGDKTPDVVIDSPSFGSGTPGPKVVAFDASGNIWVSVVAAGEVVMFTPAQIAASGRPTATVTLRGLTSPQGLAFDATGNLWVAAEDDLAVVRIDAAHLTSSGSVADLAITATGTNNLTLRPVGLAFDAAGNLWVNYDGTIASITPTQQTGTGTKTIAPAIQITTDVSTLPVGIAFDQDGGLWLAHEAGKLARFDASQLTASSSAAPATIITSPDVGFATWFAIYPAPANLPLFHKVP